MHSARIIISPPSIQFYTRRTTTRCLYSHASDGQLQSNINAKPRITHSAYTHTYTHRHTHCYFIIRQHRSKYVRRCGLVTDKSSVVCLSMQKRLNRSRRHFGCRLTRVGPRNNVLLEWGPDHPIRGNSERKRGDPL